MELLISLSGGTDILYHITGIGAAAKIVKSDQFHLKPNEGTDAEAMLSKAAYYLSTTRTRVGSYSRQSIYSYSVVFVLDGRKIGQTYRITPVDYWETLKDAEPYNTDNAYVKRRDRNESEDRVLASKPTIPAFKYIKEIHAGINDKKHLLFALKKAALLHKIPIWFYENTKDLLMLDKRKAVQVKFDKSALQQQESLPREYEYKYRLRENSIKPWLKLWYARVPEGKDTWKVAKELGDKAYNVYRRIEYSDALQGFNADLHNAKGMQPGHISKEREMLDKLVGIMREQKLTPAQFITALREKYYPRRKL